MLAVKTQPSKPKAEPPVGKAVNSGKAKPEANPNPLWASLALRVQPKLSVGAVDDPLEREADAVADRVMRMPDRPGVLPTLSNAPAGFARRKCAACAEEDEKLQRKENGPGAESPATAPPAVHEALNTPGHPLAPATRDFFEPRFGQDFAPVRVHTDHQASEAALGVSAKAFTVGRDIVFGKGHYAPESERGRRLLAHELAHVVQQGHSTQKLQRYPAKPEKAHDKPTITEPKTARLVMELIMTIMAKVEANPTHPSRWASPPPISKYKDLLSLWFELTYGKKADGSKLEREEFASAFAKADAETTPVLQASLQGAAGKFKELMIRNWYPHYFELKKTAESARRIDEYVKTTIVFTRKPQRVSREEFERVTRAHKSKDMVLQRGAGIKVGVARAGITYYPSKDEPRLVLWSSPAGVLFSIGNVIYEQNADGFSDDIVLGTVIKAAQDVAPFVDLITWRGPAYLAAFIAGVVHGFFKSIWDAISGIAKLIYEVLKSVFSLEIASDLGKLVGSLKNLSLDKIKQMLGEWAGEWAEKLNSKSPWTAGHAHGYLTGYVMAEAAMLLLTGGATTEAKAALWASDLGKMVKGSAAFKTLGTAVEQAAKVRRAVGGEFDKAVNALRASRFAGAVKAAEVTGAVIGWTADKVTKVLKLPGDIAGYVVDKAVAHAKQLGPFFERIGELSERAKRWLFGCRSPCDWEADVVAKTMGQLSNKEIEEAAKLAAGKPKTRPPTTDAPHPSHTETKNPATPKPPRVIQPSALYVHNRFMQEVLGQSTPRTFYPAGSSGKLGSRIADHFHEAERTIYEANTTPWELMTADQRTRKIGQVSADFLLIRDGQVNRSIWFGTQTLPDTGFGGQLKKALNDAGIPYWQVTPD